MGLINENFIPGEIMIEKNKILADGENRIIMEKLSAVKSNVSNVSNLPLNVLVDDCSVVENSNKKDTKKNLKWIQPKAQLVTKTNAVNGTFNMTPKRSDQLKGGAKIDPNINDLNKKCGNLSLHENSLETEDVSKIKKFNLNEIYTKKELQILSDFVNCLKKYKDTFNSLNKEDEDSITQEEDTNETALKSRGHVKKKDEKNRSKPFDRPCKSSTTSSERLQLATTPSLTFTTSDGNKAHVYFQSNQGMHSEDVVPEQGLPEHLVDQVKQVLSNDFSLYQLIEDLESDLKHIEARELQCSATNMESQALNIEYDSQPNILNVQYHPQVLITHNSSPSSLHQSSITYSQQLDETNIGSVVSLNSLGNKSSQESFGHHSPQCNANISPSATLNHQKPFMNCSPQHTGINIESMAALNPLCRTPPQQLFNNHSSLHSNCTTQPSMSQQSPQQTILNFTPQRNNIITKPVCSISPDKSIMYSSQISPSSTQFFISQAQQHNDLKVSPIPQRSPYTQRNISPNTSPRQVELFDSSYETGSPSSSSAVTSPGSPYIRSSISSESDQEFSPGEPCYSKPANITNDQTVHCIQKSILPYRAGLSRNKQIQPFGKVIQPSSKSAKQRLDELSKTWQKHYLIQLVCVVISTSKYPDDCVKGFRENLMKTMHSQMDKKHENIWKLAIFVHLEFLKAPDRVEQYKTALRGKHEMEPTLLYIAAVERNCPLIARYIAEIMYRVGINPAEVDANGDTILHKLAHLGDSHVEVLGELLAASDTQNGKNLFDVKSTNKEEKSPLHIAASSSHPQPTTIALLISSGADTIQQDKFGQTALQCHLKAMANRLDGSHWQSVDFKLAKKLFPSSPAESRRILERLSSDPSTPKIVLNIIEDLKGEIC